MKITREGYAIIEGDNYLSAEIERTGRLDVQRDMLMKYKQHIPEGGVVVDVGASLGDTAATFSEMVGENGVVYAFEPHPESFFCLRVNTCNYPKIQIRELALADTHRIARIEVDANNVGASRLVPLEEGVIQLPSVQAVTLDNYFWWKERVPRMDFIKIDAEGWEPLILDGAVETINRFRPAMLIEVNDWPLGKMNFTRRDIYERLDRLNYVYEKFDGPYGDVLCLPREKWVQVR